MNSNPAALSIRGFVAHSKHGVLELWRGESAAGLHLEVRLLGRRQAFASVTASQERALELLHALNINVNPDKVGPGVPELLRSGCGLPLAGDVVSFPAVRLEHLSARALGEVLSQGGRPFKAAQHSLLLSLLTPEDPLRALYSGIPRALLRSVFLPGGSPLSAPVECFKALLERAVLGSRPLPWAELEGRLEATIRRDLLGGGGGDPFPRPLRALPAAEAAALWSHRLMSLRCGTGGNSEALLSAAWGDTQLSRVVHCL